MTRTDIARRVYNHTWKLDPIVRSLLDTDFYKLLMLQMIWGLYPDVEATFSLINRTTTVKLADEIDEGELRAQLDHARTLRFGKKEMIWLAGNSFYGRKQIFRAGVPGLARRFPAARIRADQARRPVRAELRRPVDVHDAVGNPGARHHQRAALAHGDEGIRPLHARRALCPRQGQAVGQGRAAEALSRHPHLRFRHAPPPFVPVAALVRRGAEGRHRRFLHRHQQRDARHGYRSRGARHQCARTADGGGRACHDRRGAACSRPTRCCRTGSATMAATC